MHINTLPQDLKASIKGKDLIVFDGVCVLCCAFMRFIVSRDRAERFRFVTAQSDLGQKLYHAVGLPSVDFETNLVIVDGHIHQKLDAIAVSMTCIGWPWRALGMLRFLPISLKNPAYHLIARNRYRLFGRRDQCLIPDGALRARFYDIADET